MKFKFLVIAQKELIRFFSDKRMIFVVLIFPALTLFLMYNLLGDVFNSNGGNEKATILVYNIPDNFQDSFKKAGFKVEKTNVPLDSGEISDELDKEEYEIYIDFKNNKKDENSFQDVYSKSNMLEISIYYDSSKTLSLNSYNRIYSLIQEIEDSVFNIFEVNGDSSISYDISKVDDTTELITSILPMLLVMLAFSSSMSLSTESIAGEKERGTLATIFVTPIKKVDVAFGKIFALSIISTISVLISTTTAVLSLSNITDSDVKINDYGWQLYILIFFVMLVTIHLFIVILLIISAPRVVK